MTTKVRFFCRQSNQIWSPINLMFRNDRRSTVFHFSMHFRSPITWSVISWSAVIWAYFMPIWLADSDLNLRCCANVYALRVDAMSNKRRQTAGGQKCVIMRWRCRKIVKRNANKIRKISNLSTFLPDLYLRSCSFIYVKCVASFVTSF